MDFDLMALLVNLYMLYFIFSLEIMSLMLSILGIDLFYLHPIALTRPGSRFSSSWRWIATLGLIGFTIGLFWLLLSTQR